jgi:hypothetical protein
MPITQMDASPAEEANNRMKSRNDGGVGRYLEPGKHHAKLALGSCSD